MTALLWIEEVAVLMKGLPRIIVEDVRVLLIAHRHAKRRANPGLHKARHHIEPGKAEIRSCIRAPMIDAADARHRINHFNPLLRLGSREADDPVAYLHRQKTLDHGNARRIRHNPPRRRFNPSCVKIRSRT